MDRTAHTDRVQTDRVQNPPAPSSTAAAGLWAALAALGLVAVIAGLIAMIAGGERAGFLSETTTVDEAIGEQLEPFFPDDMPGSSDFDDAPESSVPEDPAPSGEPSDPFDGQVLPPPVARDLAQRSLDLANETTIEVGEQELKITRLGGGFCQFAGPSGKGLVIAPSGVPGTVPAGVDGGDFLAPDPNGPYSGIRIADNGDVVPVLKGEETPDTLMFGFDDNGVRTLELPSADADSGAREQLRLTPDGPLGLQEIPADFSQSGIGGLAPDVRRDAVQGDLDRFGGTELKVDTGSVQIIRHPDGTIELTGPSGRSTFLTPESVQTLPSTVAGADGAESATVFAPSPNGPISGFRLDENGDIVPVPRGAETPDMFNFGFGPTGVRELLLPNGGGESLRVSPDGERAIPRAAPQPADTAPRQAEESPDPTQSTSSEPANTADEGGRSMWPIALIALGVALLILGAFLALNAWRNNRLDDADPSADQLPERSVQDSLGVLVDRVSDQLDTHLDPRESILRAYAEFESGLAARSLVREQAESPRSFLDRTIGANPAAAEPLSRLTDLFELARFSDYPVDDDMRNRAITAVDEIRQVYALEPQLL